MGNSKSLYKNQPSFCQIINQFLFPITKEYYTDFDKIFRILIAYYRPLA